MPVWQLIEERKKDTKSALTATELEEVFEGGDEVSTSAIDITFKTEWLASASDVTSAEWLGTMKEDTQSLNKALVFATGLILKKKLPKELRYKPVMQRFLEEWLSTWAVA